MIAEHSLTYFAFGIICGGREWTYPKQTNRQIDKLMKINRLIFFFRIVFNLVIFFKFNF